MMRWVLKCQKYEQSHSDPTTDEVTLIMVDTGQHTVDTDIVEDKDITDSTIVKIGERAVHTERARIEGRDIITGIAITNLNFPCK